MVGAHSGALDLSQIGKICRFDHVLTLNISSYIHFLAHDCTPASQKPVKQNPVGQQRNHS